MSRRIRSTVDEMLLVRRGQARRDQRRDRPPMASDVHDSEDAFGRMNLVVDDVAAARTTSTLPVAKLLDLARA